MNTCTTKNCTNSRMRHSEICVECAQGHPVLAQEAMEAMHADALSQQVKAADAVKHDFDKLPMELLDPLWLEAVAEVLGFGARKYAAENWRKGFKHTRLLGAAVRHLIAWQRGEDTDPESGLPHLAHASCCLMFLTNLAHTRPDLDDRWKCAPRA